MGNQAAQRLLRDAVMHAGRTGTPVPTRGGAGARAAFSAPVRPSESARLQRERAGGAPATSEECSACRTVPRSGRHIALTVNEPGDVGEREADRLADQVMATPARVGGASPRVHRSARPPTGQMEVASARVGQALSSSGRPLEPALRRDMEQRFDQDFSRVRVHADAAAAQSAADVNARAYTVGHDIVFGQGWFATQTHDGRRLLAHELAHVVQHRQGPCPELQRSRLHDYDDSDAMHDPSKLTDAQIEATNEFKALMDSKLIWQWKHHLTREEALLACRLILRRLREGESVDWVREAAAFVMRTRKQLGTLREAERLVGELRWVVASWTQFNEPATAQTDFTRWILAGGPEPTDVGKMNCWEMILWGAVRGGIVEKAWVEDVYTKAKAATITSPQSATAPVIEIENALCGMSSNVTFRPTDPRSPEPLPGDIIIFDVIENHAAISLGTTAIGGDHWVISLHASPATPHSQVEIVTLEQLLRDTGLTTAKLCRAPWRGRREP